MLINYFHRPSIPANAFADRMWKRLNRPRDPAIGSPALIDTTFDQRYLESIPEVESVRSGHSSVVSPSLPSLPLYAFNLTTCVCSS